uniref:Cyclin-like domain-containing protein n=2 Tax=Pseudo-nitzschia australis TaxID=44445 RepID=A0A7S4AKQ4_9STRA
MMASSSSLPAVQPPSTANDNKLTILDCSVSIILENPDQTASRQSGIDAYTERLHRFHGTSIILESCRGLSLEPSTYATACTIFHRFYHPASLTEYDVWSVAMASTLLATKVEDEPKSLKQIIEEYAKIYARRLILADLSEGKGNVDNNSNNSNSDNNKTVIENKESKDLALSTIEDLVQSSPHLSWLPGPIDKWKTADERRRICVTRLPQQLSKFGPVYKEWHEQITKMESILLRQLGFTFHWISDSHPHKFILNFCQALGLNDKKFTQRAWNYCNDSCRLDLSVRYLPEIIASSAILLAARDFNTMLPVEPRTWWEVFIGNEVNKGQELVDVANAILGTCNLHLGMGKGREESNKGEDEDDIKKLYVDWLAASEGFLRSLVNTSNQEDVEKSFNDPDSFLWYCQKETFEKEIQKQ